jgi:hypothetical protein
MTHYIPIKVGQIEFCLVGLNHDWEVRLKDWRGSKIRLSRCIFFPFDEPSRFRTMLLSLIDEFCTLKMLLLHSLAVVRNGEGVVFVGMSGSGKSTLARKFEQQSGYEVYSEEANLIDFNSSPMMIYETPVRGKEDNTLGKPSSARLKRLCFLHHADENRIEKIGYKKAIEPLILNHWNKGEDNDFAERLLDFVFEAKDEIGFYNLYFKKDIDIGVYGGVLFNE